MHVPGVLVDVIVVAPDQMQTTQTAYDPAISGEYVRAEGSFRLAPWGVDKVIARRVAQELQAGWAVNLGFGISANVPRILLEEGRHGDVTWVIEQGAVGGVPLLDFQFGCAANAEAIMPSPQQFTYFQGAGFDCSLLSFLQIDAEGSVNVSRLAAKPHVTAGCGGFVDITARAKRIVFSGYFTAGAKLAVDDGSLQIAGEGKVKKVVPEVEHVSFSGRRAVEQGQDVTYVTERCVMELTPDGHYRHRDRARRRPRARRAGPGGHPARGLAVAAPDGRAAVPAGADRPLARGGARMTAGSVRVEIEGAVGTVVLARPAKLNALDLGDARRSSRRPRRGSSAKMRSASCCSPARARRRSAPAPTSPTGVPSTRSGSGGAGCGRAIASSTAGRGCASR